MADYSDEARLKALGFRADNSNLTLASRFATLADAQAVFPSAQSLNEYLDGCCVERLIQTNEIYWGRSAIQLPAGGIRFSRGIDTVGKEVSIEGAGRGVTQLIPFFTNGTLFSHRGGNRQFRIANLSITNEAPGGNANTRALDISYSASPGYFMSTVITDVDIYGFSNPIRITNPGRGLRMDRVSVFGPHFACQHSAGIEIVLDDSSSDQSAEACFKSVRVANYRWGWDVQMRLGAGGTEANRRSMEGFIFIDCGAYNGWGLCRCQQAYTGYSALLWEFIACDWQGAGNALDMERCNQIIVRGGFWIANIDAPGTDFVDPMGGPHRRYFKFRGCNNVQLDRLRLDVSQGFPAHTLIELDTDCYDVLIENCIVRDYSNSAVAGFMICGNAHDTVKEVNTTWQAWGSNPEKRVYDVFANQISQTNAMSRGGTVDPTTGTYTFKGRSTVTLDGNGNALIALPRRPITAEANGGQVTPFFLAGAVGDDFSPYIVASNRSFTYVAAPTINAASVWEFIVTYGPGMAGQQVTFDWIAMGR